MLPAAGTGSRLPDRELSKELLPYGIGGGHGEPVISHLVNCVREAGICDVIIVLREGKRDISEFLTGSEWAHVTFSYKMTQGTSGVPETVALGLQDAGTRRVVFGFPDILFEPKDAFVRMIDRLDNSNADVVLGLFPTESPGKMDMVRTDDEGRVLDIEIKPDTTALTLTWILAVWKPAFSAYLGDLLRNNPARLDELVTGTGGGHLGHVFQLAMADGMLIASESFVNGRSLDIGTPDDLARARAWIS